MTNRYITTEETIELGDPKPSGLWKESSNSIDYVEEKIVKKSSRLSFRRDVHYCLSIFTPRNLQIPEKN